MTAFQPMTLVLGLCLLGTSVFAQSRTQSPPPTPKSVRVIGASTPLRGGPAITFPAVTTVGQGTVLEVVGRDGDWYRVTLSSDMVTDPNAPKTAYVLSRLVEVMQTDVSATNGQTTSRSTEERTQQPSEPKVQAVERRGPGGSETSESTPGTATRRGDFSVGYTFLHDSPVNVPAGFILSDAWRLGRSSADVVFDFALSHNTQAGLGATYRMVAGGIRGSSSSRYGQRVTSVYGVEAGFLTASLSGVGSGNAFLIRPIVGAEISLARQVSLRPQFDYMFLHFGNGAGWFVKDWSVEMNAVFPLWRTKQ